MDDTLTVAEIKRRSMAAIEEGLQRGPIHIVKRNKPAAVVLSEEEYRRLIQCAPAGGRTMTAVQWLLAQPMTNSRDKAHIDAELGRERDW